MTTNDPLPTVQRMFEAFATGDLDRLLETVHPDSHWTYVGANPRPAKRVYVGREDVRKFFGKIIRNLNITTFHPREFVTENDTVGVIGFESGTVTATGHPFRNEWVQKYVVQDDLITDMEEYNIQVEHSTMSSKLMAERLRPSYQATARAAAKPGTGTPDVTARHTTRRHAS